MRTILPLLLLLASTQVVAQEYEERLLSLTFRNQGSQPATVWVEDKKACTVPPGENCYWDNRPDAPPGPYIVEVRRDDGGNYEDAVSAGERGCRSFTGYSYTFILKDTGVSRKCP